jgi:hypothetical protein
LITKIASIVLTSGLSRLSAGTNALYAGYIALHELIHVITNKGDFDLSQTVHKMGLGSPDFPKDGKNYAYSKYWDAVLKDACLPKGY